MTPELGWVGAQGLCPRRTHTTQLVMPPIPRLAGTCHVPLHTPACRTGGLLLMLCHDNLFEALV